MPSPTQNTFMDRMRQMMFRLIRNQAPEPARPDYNEQPSADESVQIPVGPDYSPFLFQNVNVNDIQPSVFRHAVEQEQAVRDSAWERFQQSRSAQQAQSHDGWYVQMPESTAQRQARQHALDRERAMRTPQGATWTFIDEQVPEWLAHRKDGFYLQDPMENGGAIEATVKKAGITCIVLPTISVESGQVEYRKHSAEPTNGAQRTEFEEFAMKEIRKWAAENKTLAAMA